MDIIKNLLSDVITLSGVTADLDSLLHNLDDATTNGVVTRHTIIVFANAGIPIISIFSGVLHIDNTQTVALIENGRFSYDDLICAISIYAQEIKREYQIRRINRV